jgi:hypothetical protein
MVFRLLDYVAVSTFRNSVVKALVTFGEIGRIIKRFS